MRNFWTLRVPFYFKHDTETIFVTRGYNGTHETWANQLGLTRLQRDSSPRGFFWPQTNELFFYYGPGTTDFLLAQLDVQAVIDELIYKVRGNANTTVWGGVVIDPDAVRMQGIHKYGNVESFKRTPLDDARQSA